MAADGSVVIQISADDKEASKTLNALEKAVGKTIQGLSAAAAAAGAAVVAIGKQSIAAYANYEQLVGGVETLFQDSSDIVSGYAANAYKTAGLSANAYMETVTSFSASLLQSLGNDTAEAARVADMAVTDMSDNANKMGTSMESIQNAYQGFAKQNYTMLDNLKLGYGGTKSEMERLLAEAGKLSGQSYDISSFADIAEAIHVIQTNMEISGLSYEEAMQKVANGEMTLEEATKAMGTTAKEAMETIQGSASAMRAAWENLLVGLADDTQDFDGLLLALIDSVGIFGQQLVPRIEVALGGIAKLAEKLAPQIAEILPRIASDILPKITSGAASIVTSLLSGVTDNLTKIEEGASGILEALINGIFAALPALVEAAPQIITTLVNVLADNIPAIANCGVQLLTAIIYNLPQIVTTIVGAIPTIVLGITKALMGSLNQIITVGENIVMGLWDGISRRAGWIKQKVSDFFSGIVSSVKGLLGIHSPSKVFAEIGNYTIAGFIEGVDAQKDDLREAMQEATDLIIDQLPDDSDVDDTLKAFSTAYDKNLDAVVAKSKADAKELENSLGGIEKAWDDVAKKQESMVGKLSGYGSLFSEDDGYFRLGSIKAEINVMKDYADMLDQLRDKEIPNSLMSEVMDMSVDDALGYGKKLLSQTDDQWKAYTEAWEEKQSLAKQIADDFYKDQLESLETEYNDKLAEGLMTLNETSFDAGRDTIAGLMAGMRSKESELYAKATSIANNIAAAMQEALDINSPSRKMRTLVGEPAAQGVIAGFEDELSGWSRRMQAAVNAETGRISIKAATQTDARSAAGGLTREIHTSTNTIEKVARLEGDGITDELIRILGLRLKEEDNRVGYSFA